MLLWNYELNTPLGPMRAAFDGRGRLCELAMEGLDPRKTSPIPPREQREAKRFLDRQLEAYLASTLRTFTIPLAPQGSPSQLRIWDLIQTIPYGQTRSVADVAHYGHVDEDLVVMALVSNPIALLIPTHRVVREGEGPLPRALRDLESGLGWRKPS